MSLESWKQTTEDVEERLYKQGQLVSGSLISMAIMSALGLGIDFGLFNRWGKIKKSWKQGDKSGLAANAGQVALAGLPLAGSSALKYGGKGLQALKGLKGVGAGAQTLSKGLRTSELGGGVAGIAGGVTGNKNLTTAAKFMNPSYGAATQLEKYTPNLNSSRGNQYRTYPQSYNGPYDYHTRFLPSGQRSDSEQWSRSGQQPEAGQSVQNKSRRYQVNPVPEDSGGKSSGIASWFSPGSGSVQTSNIQTEPNLYQKYVLDKKQQV